MQPRVAGASKRPKKGCPQAQKSRKSQSSLNRMRRARLSDPYGARDNADLLVLHNSEYAAHQVEADFGSKKTFENRSQSDMYRSGAELGGPGQRALLRISDSNAVNGCRDTAIAGGHSILVEPSAYPGGSSQARKKSGTFLPADAVPA